MFLALWLLRRKFYRLSPLHFFVKKQPKTYTQLFPHHIPGDYILNKRKSTLTDVLSNKLLLFQVFKRKKENLDIVYSNLFLCPNSTPLWPPSTSRTMIKFQSTLLPVTTTTIVQLFWPYCYLEENINEMLTILQ